MPVFGGSSKRHSVSHQTPANNQQENKVTVTATPSLSPLPAAHSLQAPPTKSVIPTRKELAFHCQLAHGSATKDIQDFSNVKELYTRIGQAFSISPSEIIFCTLNTHKADMTHLLGGQIGLEDFIFAHIKGQTKSVRVQKSDPALGLTITDNGAGSPFIKKLRENSIVAMHPDIYVSDMIESINGQSMVGCRHYEVAKLLKELPQFSEISLQLIETRKAFDAIAPRGASGKGNLFAVPVMEGCSEKLEEKVTKTEGRATLRLKNNGLAAVEEIKLWESKAALRVDDLLETFLGIRDLELAQTMVDFGKDKKTLEQFSATMNDHLGEFEFPDDFITDVWASILRAKTVTTAT